MGLPHSKTLARRIVSFDFRSLEAGIDRKLQIPRLVTSAATLRGQNGGPNAIFCDLQLRGGRHLI